MSTPLDLSTVCNRQNEQAIECHLTECARGGKDNGHKYFNNSQMECIERQHNSLPNAFYTLKQQNGTIVSRSVNRRNNKRKHFDPRHRIEMGHFVGKCVVCIDRRLKIG